MLLKSNEFAELPQAQIWAKISGGNRMMNISGSRFDQLKGDNGMIKQIVAARMMDDEIMATNKVVTKT